MQWENVEPRTVLYEMARFYGIFVPVEDRWGFVHRTLQDYLAAQQWVESGSFAQDVARGKVTFDARAAYAACQLTDATAVMKDALEDEHGLSAFVDMLANDATFDHPQIA